MRWTPTRGEGCARVAQARTERALACVFQRACLAADGLTWPSTHRRCDFRDCQSMIYSLVDMMNLARTRLILGSGYSSYSALRLLIVLGDRGPDGRPSWAAVTASPYPSSWRGVTRLRANARMHV